MTPERIKELRAIIAAATPGPLTIAEKGTYPDDEGAKVLFPVRLNRLGVPVRICAAQYLTDDMAKFIVESRTALPDCLDTIEAQQRRIEELEAALKPFASDELHEGLDDGPDDKMMTWPSFRLGELRAARSALQPKETS